jgi:ATP-dependent Lon protease
LNNAKKLNNDKNPDGYRPNHVPRALKVIYGEETSNHIAREEKDMQVPGKQNMRRLPLIPLKGVIVYPGMRMHLDVGREKSIRALEKAIVEDSMILLCSQTEVNIDDPSADDIYRIGTIAKVRKVENHPNGTTIRILVQGIIRAEAVVYLANGTYYEVDVREIPEEESADPEIDLLMRTVFSRFEHYVSVTKKVTPEKLAAISDIGKPGRLADVISSCLSLEMKDKQEFLETIDVKKRLEMLLPILNNI